MKKAYRNIVKGYERNQLVAICKYNAEQYNETWYMLADSGMAANKKDRKGYEQYAALAFHPDGTMTIVQAFEKV
jgi:hypothetical protein